MRLLLFLLVLFGGLNSEVSSNTSHKIKNPKIKNFSTNKFSGNHRTAINPTLTINAFRNTTICDGDSVKLSTCNAHGSFLQWYFVSGGKSSILTALVGANGTTYYAKNTGDYLLISYDLNGTTCTSNTISIIVNTSSSVSISVSGNLIFCPGGNVLLKANTSAFNNLLWSTGDTHQIILATSPGTYFVTATNPKNGCSSVSPSVITSLHSLRTDINIDGITDYSDYLMLIHQFNNICTNCKEDIDSDGIVKNEDFLKLLGDYNRSCN